MQTERYCPYSTLSVPGTWPFLEGSCIGGLALPDVAAGSTE